MGLCLKLSMELWTVDCGDCGHDNFHAVAFSSSRRWALGVGKAFGDGALAF